MIKFILATTVGISCFMCGIIKSNDYKLRVLQLIYFRDMMHILSGELAYRKDPIILLLQRIKPQTSGLASEFISYVTSGEAVDMQQIWETAADKIYLQILNNEDIEILKEVGAGLGTGGVLQQQSMIVMITDKLNIQIKKAEEDYTAKGRICRAIGGFCGAAAVILLI